MDLFQVMNDTEQIPLAVDLVAATESKSVQPHNPADVGKGRFRYCQSHGIHGSAHRRINLALHLLDAGVLSFFRATKEISNLSDLGSFRMTQALTSKSTGQAG